MQNHLTFTCFVCILPLQRRLERYLCSTRLGVLKLKTIKPLIRIIK
jgi:hypothetical protein